jgi:beta-mannosidase
VASWSITDYYNRSPKAAWYAVKEAYRDDVRPERDQVKPIDLKLSDPKITWQVEGNTIILKSTSFAKYVFIDIAGYRGKFSDNYFDLNPGVEKIITFDKTELRGSDLKIKVKSLYDIQARY